MPKPWEKYSQEVESSKPWERYSDTGEPTRDGMTRKEWQAEYRTPFAGEYAPEVGQVEAATRGISQGLTFGFGDEASALLASQLTGAPYDVALEVQRRRLGEGQENYPKTALAGEVAGGILTGAGLAKSAPTITTGLSNFAAKGLGRKMLTGAGVGGASAGLYGFGTGEGGLDERTGKAQSLGLMGAGVGAALPFAGAVASPFIAKGERAVGSLAERARNAFGKTATPTAAPRTAQEIAEAGSEYIPPELIQSQAFNKVQQAILRDFPDNPQEALQAWLKGDESLVEMYGAGARRLAKGAAQYESGQRAGEKFFGEKIATAPEKVRSAIKESIGGVEDFYKSVDDVLEEGRKKASPFYNNAYKASIKDTDIILKPEVKSALEKAYRQYPSELQGVEPNSIKALDYAKRVLDDEIGAAKRAGEGNLARSRTLIKNELLDKMDDASPDYRKARKLAGDSFRVENAMADGLDFMKLDPAVLGRKYKALQGQEKEAFKLGISKKMTDLVDKAYDGSNTYNRLIGNEVNRKRLQAVLSPTDFKKLSSNLKAQDRLYKLRNEVLGGSPTASKQLAAGDIASAGADIADAMQTGGMVASVKNAIFRTIKKTFDGLDDSTAEQVAKILYETDPSKKLEMLNRMKNARNMAFKQRKGGQEAYFKLNDAIIKGKE